MKAERVLEIANGEDSLYQIACRLGLSQAEQAHLQRELTKTHGREAPHVLKGILQGVEAGRSELEWCVC